MPKTSQTAKTGMTRLDAFNKLTEAADLIKHVQIQGCWEASGLKLTPVELKKINDAKQMVFVALREMEKNPIG